MKPDTITLKLVCNLPLFNRLEAVAERRGMHVEDLAKQLLLIALSEVESG